MFFDAEASQGVEIAAIPAEMGVGVAEAGEEGAVATLGRCQYTTCGNKGTMIGRFGGCELEDKRRRTET